MSNEYNVSPEKIKLVRRLEKAGIRCFLGDSIETLRELAGQLKQGEKL